MKPLWVIARREFAGIFTERTILLAVVIQVFVAGFSSFLVVGLSALFDPTALPAQPRMEIALSPEAAADEMLVGALDGRGLVLVRADGNAEALALFESGRVDGAILAQDVGDPGKPAQLTLVLPDGDLRATLTLTKVKESLEAYERHLREERRERLGNEPLYVDSGAKAGSYAFVYSLLIPLLIFLPVVLSGALSADSLTEEVQRGTLPLLLASPATAGDVVQGKLLANVGLTPLLTIAWFALLAVNGLTVPLDGAVLILVLGSAIAFLMGLLACVIALATRDRNKTHLLYAMSMFFLLALSLALPVSPVNAVALLAAGSPNPGVHGTVLVTTLAALAGAVGLRVALRRAAPWMLAAGS